MGIDVHLDSPVVRLYLLCSFLGIGLAFNDGT